MIEIVEESNGLKSLKMIFVILNVIRDVMYNICVDVSRVVVIKNFIEKK